jgi:hypothetical protein
MRMVAAGFENGFCGSSFEIGFFGTSLREGILWQQIIGTKCVVAGCEKAFYPFCSLECGDADLLVYRDTGLEIYRMQRVTIQMLKRVP